MPSGPLHLAPSPSPSEDLFESREGERVRFLPLTFPHFFSSCSQVHEAEPLRRCPVEAAIFVCASSFYSGKAGFFSLSALYPVCTMPKWTSIVVESHLVKK